MEPTSATALAAALAADGLQLRASPSTEAIQAVHVARVNVSWPLQEHRAAPFAGIPNKRLVSGKALIDGVPPEVAVARAVRSGCSADSWWSAWGSETIGISASSRRRENHPERVAVIIATLAARTRDLMVACDHRSTEEGIPWRESRPTKAGKPSMRGGLWDVVVLRTDGALDFIECKEDGKDFINDAQRAFLEAALERKDTKAKDMAIVSWTRA